MSRKMSLEELADHCGRAVSSLGALLADFSASGIDKMAKRAMLISYWVGTYTKYLREEDSFSPQSVFRLKRGAIVRVEFGYRIGRELGGRHYAVVLDNNNSINRNTVTVIPLGSKKADSKDDMHNVVLVDGVYSPVKKKLDALIADAKRTADEAREMSASIKAASPEKQSVLRAVHRQKIDTAQRLIVQATAWVDEISHLQAGSVAKVDQITTISKVRISQPLQKSHPLYGVRLSSRDLEKIDAQIVSLYFPQKNQ